MLLGAPAGDRMSFRLIFELEPPRVPDLTKVRKQLEIFGPIVDSFLIPDNHLGMPAMSSVALAVEVLNAGYTPIVGINARDRNHLRFASDMMTLKAYGIDEVLFLYGDPISEGRTGFNVKKMLAHEASQGFIRGVAATIGHPLGWRARADTLFTQLAFGRKKPGYWREAEGFSHPVYCGVIALPDAILGKKILGNIPELEAPDGLLDDLERDPEAGFRAAIQELEDLRSSGVDGAQIVVPARRRRFAEMLQEFKEGH